MIARHLTEWLSAHRQETAAITTRTPTGWSNYKRRRRFLQLVRRRQASASDLFPSPAGSAARAREQPTSHRRCFAAITAFPPLPPRAVAAPSQLRLPSPNPYSSTSKDSRPICCGFGHSPASLVACRSDASWHLHSVPPSVPKHAPCSVSF